MPVDSKTKFTNLIDVSVKTAYLPEQSQPNECRFVFSYTITITNNSTDSIQLMSRFWQINDADGQESTVQGIGVVGQQPIIAPLASYTYTSGSIFKTPIGTMKGHYVIQDSAQHSFIVNIPVFRLAIPNILN